jgi:hypothetical protein
MKYSSVSIGLVALALFVIPPMKANAEVIGPAPASWSFDEDGHGRVNFPDGSFQLLPGSMAVDPGPGGRASALTYTYIFTTVFVTGDVFLTEAGGNSDVIRFNWSPTTLAGSLVFYSLPGEGQLADTGLPSAFYTNTFSILENPNGPTSYTPTAGQPGFLSGLNITYFLNSPSAVPEGGSSICFLALGLVALIYGRCRIVART